MFNIKFILISLMLIILVACKSEPIIYYIDGQMYDSLEVKWDSEQRKHGFIVGKSHWDKTWYKLTEIMDGKMYLLKHKRR